MENTVASLYEVIEKIDSGGFGEVYLARHKNLNTKVVLKAERLKKKINEAQLRREVDILKTLKNPYIPVVYDYFVENNTAYTVMEYIEGESLEKCIKRGDHFRLPQIIKWGIQILEALAYLHSPTHGDPPRGYVHSDIKPANVMIRPSGDISLIDFNVSMAIGEDSVIGLTRGYASPEHYGLCYTDDGLKTHRLIDESGMESTDSIGTWETYEGTDSIGTWETYEGTEDTATDHSRSTVPNSQWSTAADSSKSMAAKREGSVGTDGSERTLPDRARSTEPYDSSWADSTSSGVRASSQPSRKSSWKKRKIMPDERSDLYSVGALLYHLVSGNKPAANVLEVEPLSPTRYNGQIVSIIEKAMNANPARRYQSAGEMLQAFYGLKVNDPRNKSLKKSSVAAACLTGVLLAAGLVCAFIGLRRMQKKEEWLKLTEYSNKAYEDGDIDGALRYALEACPQEKGLFTPAIREQTQLALTQALEVYKLSDGYRTERIAQLPSEPLFADVSPDGKLAACICLGQLIIMDTETAETIATLPTQESALAEVRFVDSDTLLYAGSDGLTAYDLQGGKAQWTGHPATGIALSGDGKRAAGIYKDEKVCYVYDVSSGKVIREIDLEGRYQPVTVNNIGFNPRDNLLVLNEDGTRLGISLDKGTVRIYDLEDESLNIELSDDSSRFGHFEGGFYGNLFLFAGSDEERAEIMVIDVDAGEIVYNRADFGLFHVKASEDGIWMSRDNRIMRYNPETRDLEQYLSTGDQIKGFSQCRERIIAVTDSEIITMDGEGSVLSRAERNTAADIVAVSDQTLLTGNFNSNIVQLLKYADMSDKICAVYDPSYPHVETRISADGEHLLLSTERDFSIYRADGRRVTHVELPGADQIYDQQYVRKDGSSVLEITYYDGTVDTYDGANGKKLGSENRGAPDLSLKETLETEHYRVESQIHHKPVVYDAKSGQQIAEIDEDAYLTYADEVNGMLVLRFITTDLVQYGCMFDANGRIVARMPYLCDVYGDQLYFDYQDGAVRKTPAFSLEELLSQALAK